MENLSERIKEIRGNTNQSDFAAELNVDRTSIVKYESDVVKPTFDFYYKIIMKKGININWLITGEGPKFIESFSSTKSVDNYINRIKELETQLANLRSSMQLVLNETWNKPDKKQSKKNRIIPLNKYGLLNEFQKN